MMTFVGPCADNDSKHTSWTAKNKAYRAEFTYFKAIVFYVLMSEYQFWQYLINMKLNKWDTSWLILFYLTTIFQLRLYSVNQMRCE
jgi:hypothetical protein